MRALRGFLTTLGFALIVSWAIGAVAIEWTLRDVPRPTPPRGPPTLAHRGLACVSIAPRPGWLRNALIRHPTAEVVARQHTRSLNLRTVSHVTVEWALSVWLSRHYDDDQLTRMAGDTVWLGRGAYGLEEGARVWFGKRLEQLSLAQGALLVGLEPMPMKLDPTRDATRAQQRRDLVLRAWERCGLIPVGSAGQLAATPVLEGVLLPGTALAPPPEDED